MLKEFWNINLGEIVTIIAFCIAAIGFIYTMRGKVDSLAEDMSTIKDDMKKLVDILINQGKQETELSALRDAHLLQGQRLDELARRVNNYLDHRLSQ